MKIAISGLNNTDNPAPGIPVAKSLDNYNLVGLSYSANEPGIYQNLFDDIYLMPYPSLGFDELKPRLEYIKRTSQINAIIPNLDAELPLYIKYQQQIEQMGIKLCLPTQQNFELRNKNKLDKLATALNIKYPKTYEISSITGLRKVINQEDFPLMIKGNYYKSYQVYNLESAIDAFTNIANEWGLPVLAQKFVHGEEFNLVGVADGNANLCGAVTMKKLTTTDIGKVWLGLSIHNKALLDIAIDFVQQTSWKGPFELECIISNNDIYLIEINPRFPAWVYFATDIGINLPQMVIDIMNNNTIKPNFDYLANKMYVRFVDELVTDFENYKKLFLNKELKQI